MKSSVTLVHFKDLPFIQIEFGLVEIKTQKTHCGSSTSVKIPQFSIQDLMSYPIKNLEDIPPTPGLNKRSILELRQDGEIRVEMKKTILNQQPGSNSFDAHTFE